MCAERNVAVQTIKSITRAPGETGSRPRAPGTSHSPTRARSTSRWPGCSGRDGLFLNTVGDVTILPKVLAAAAKVTGRPDAEAMRSLEESFGLQPLFT